MAYIIGMMLAVVVYVLVRKPKLEVSAMTETKRSAVPKNAARNNLIHDVILANTNLISDKLLGILAYILGEQADEHGLLSIVFTPEYPKTNTGENLLSKFLPEARCMVVNLNGHIEMAEEVMKEDNNNMSMWAYLWMMIIKSFWHELHHAHTFADAENIYNVDTNAADFEVKAEDWCNEMMLEMAKSIDIEPPAFDDFPYYTDRLYETMGAIGEGKWETDWALHQLDLMGEGLTYYKPGIDGKSDPIRCITLRDYFAMVDGSGDKCWNAPVKGMADMIPTKAVAEPELVMEVVEAPAASGVDPGLEVIKPNIQKVIAENQQVENILHTVATHPRAGDDTEPEFTAEMMDGQPMNPYDDFDQGAEEAFDGVTIVDDAGAAVPRPALTAAVKAQPTPVKTEAVVVQPIEPIPVKTEIAQPGGGAVAVGNILGQGLPTPTKPTAPLLQLEPHGLTKDEMLTCLQAILLTLYGHIFNKCGWDGAGGFTNTAGILEPVSLAHIPNADKLLVSCDTVVNGQSVLEQPFEGTVAGKVMLEGRSCGYHLTFNQRGMKSKRTFKPADALACHASGELKDWSKKAQAGHAIGMMLDDKGVKAKCHTIPGGETMYEFDLFKG